MDLKRFQKSLSKFNVVKFRKLFSASAINSSVAKTMAFVNRTSTAKTLLILEK